MICVKLKITIISLISYAFIRYILNSLFIYPLLTTLKTDVDIKLKCHECMEMELIGTFISYLSYLRKY